MRKSSDNTFQNGDRIKIHERMATLEAQVQTILSNHLPHIQSDIKGVKKLQWWTFATMFAGAMALILNLIQDRL